MGPGQGRQRVRTTGGARSRRYNEEHPHTKRGLAITPVKFGISFNFTSFNQAGALVHVYKDGSVLINHGGTEMGQGLHTKMLQVAATALGVPLEQGAAGADPHRQGAQHLGHRRECGRRPQRRRGQGTPASRSSAGSRHVRAEHPDASWDELVRIAYHARIQLWAAGFYKTEGLSWDVTTMTGSPFKYFAYGAAVSEVEVDGFTGAYDLRRVDIVHDVGDSLSPLVDLGQVEGGFVQGAGWLTLEDLRWDTSDGPNRGRLTPSRRRRTSCRASRRCPRSSTSRCSSTPTRTARSTARRPSASRR